MTGEDFHKLHVSGKTYLEISLLNGVNISRNAVASKIRKYRAKMGLKGPKPRPKINWVKLSRQSPPKPLYDPILRTSQQENYEKQLCKFIFGERPYTGLKDFCGHIRIEGLPYCQGHIAACCVAIQIKPKKRPAF